MGDIITTNSSFKPTNKSDEPIDIGNDKYRGMILYRIGDYFGIRFGAGLEFTDFLDGKLSKPVGCTLKRNEFDVETT